MGSFSGSFEGIFLKERFLGIILRDLKNQNGTIMRRRKSLAICDTITRFSILSILGDFTQFPCIFRVFRLLCRRQGWAFELCLLI